MKGNRVSAAALKLHLFGALEALNQDFENPDFDKELFLLEVEKANAIGEIASQIINLQKLEIQHNTLLVKSAKYAESQAGVTKMIVASTFFENAE